MPLRDWAQLGHFEHGNSRSVTNCDYTIKFTESGHVNINVRLNEIEAKPYIRFDIEDTGIGIPKQLIPDLFEQYEHKKHHLQQLEPDTGLGLAIVKKYVTAMNGRVWCESKAEEGSSFFVEFEAL